MSRRRYPLSAQNRTYAKLPRPSEFNPRRTFPPGQLWRELCRIRVLPRSQDDARDRHRRTGSRPSAWPRTALIKECHRLWTLHIARFQSRHPETVRLDQRADRAIQVAATSDPLPCRGQPVLPFPNIGIRREAMLDEQELPAWLEDAAHLVDSFISGLTSDTSRGLRSRERAR